MRTWLEGQDTSLGRSSVRGNHVVSRKQSLSTNNDTSSLSLLLYDAICHTDAFNFDTVKFNNFFLNGLYFLHFKRPSSTLMF